MAWSLKKRIIVSCSVGWALTILGAVMIPLLEWVVKKKIQNTVIIQEGGDVYDYWLDPPVPIYMQIYMFNITNPEEFLSGSKPSVVQRGPYTYSERRIKFNITWNENGTVSYRQKRVFKFLPHMSSGLETDVFLTPNLVYWALYGALKFEDARVRKLCDDITTLFDEHVLMTRSVKEIIWGYVDPALHSAKSIDPRWFYTDFIGYFMNKNDTDDGVYTVYTGADDINQLGIIDKYNGTRFLPFWSTKYANMVNGSDGTIGPPYLPKDIRLYSFASDICRSVAGEFTEEVQTTQGIGLWRFQAPPSYLDNATANPDNIGFCTPQDHCLGTGIFNATACQSVDFFHLPVALSFPHFLFADPKYINGVVGIAPDPLQHDAAIDLEPYTGLVLQAFKRLQINLYLEPVENVTETLNIKPVFLPVFWINESAVIDDKNAEKFFSLLLTPVHIIHAIEGVVIGLGLAILIGTVLCGVRVSRKEAQQRDVTEDERTPIKYSDERMSYDSNMQQ